MAYLDGTGREKGKAPLSGEKGAVYNSSRGGHGPSKAKLARATVDWLKANKPEVLNSKVEIFFRERGLKNFLDTTLLAQVSPNRAEKLQPFLSSPRHTHAYNNNSGTSPSSCCGTWASSALAPFRWRVVTSS